MSAPFPTNENHRPLAPIEHPAGAFPRALAEECVTPSALHSRAIAPSHTLAAAGITPEHTQSSLHVSLIVESSPSSQVVPGNADPPATSSQSTTEAQVTQSTVVVAQLESVVQFSSTFQ